MDAIYKVQPDAIFVLEVSVFAAGEKPRCCNAACARQMLVGTSALCDRCVAGRCVCQCSLSWLSPMTWPADTLDKAGTPSQLLVTQLPGVVLWLWCRTAST